MKKLLGVIILAFALGGCALSPEAKLVKGYQSVTITAKTTTVLVDQDRISVPNAERVLKFGQGSKAVLDAGKEALKKCRAEKGADCKGAVANINLGSGILQELEKYLEANK